MRHAVIGIVGQSEYGKTYFTKKITAQLKRIIVVDPKSEFDEGFFVKSEMVEVVQAMFKSEFRISAQFDKVDDYDLLFIAIKEFENFTLVIDEASLFCSASFTNEDLRQIVQIIGSKKCINVIWNAQRPANVSRDITSQTHVVLSFRVLESADSRYFTSYWRRGQGEKELTELPVGEFRIVRGDKETFDKLMKGLDSYKIA